MVWWVSGWLKRLASQLQSTTGARVYAVALIRLAKVDHQPVTSQQADRFGTGDTIHRECPPTFNWTQQWAASSVITQHWCQWPYGKMPTYTCRSRTEWRYMREWKRSMGSTKCPPWRHGVQDMVLHCQSFKTNKTLILQCMYHACLSNYCLSWFNNMHLFIHSSYTCTVTLRQHRRPKNTAVTSYHATHMSPLQHRAVQYIQKRCDINSSVLKGGGDAKYSNMCMA